jgi:glutamyl endopeptidase
MAQQQDAEWFARLLPSNEQLDELLGDDPTTALIGVARDRAPVEMGVEQPPDLDQDPELRQLFELAAAAAKKLKASMMPSLSPDEVQALHALVHLVSRPALRVRNGDVPAIPASWQRLEGARGVIKVRLRGIGRLDTPDRHAMGTGWFIAPDLLATNNHVVAALCGIPLTSGWRAQLGEAVPVHDHLWKREPSQRPVWDPGDAPASSDAASGRVTGIRMTHAQHDMAFLDVAGVKGSEQLVLPLASAPSGEPIDVDYYLGGYPVVTPQLTAGLHPALVDVLFGGTDQVVHKRVSPGGLIGFASPDAQHDASTLRGSSGSPVIDLTTHRVVGLHYSGVYGERNQAVAMWTIKDDAVFRDFGITFT